MREDHQTVWVPLLSVLVCVGCLTPFVAKPFYIDDPLFVLAGQQIQQHPADPYGFDVHWYVSPERMADVTKNPPLACYVLALAGSLFGWSEIALHGFFLLPAAGVAWGTCRLAQDLCARPLLAALAAVLTPVFLVSSTTVMCDTLMLCFWVWAIVCWRRALERPGWFFVAGILISLCALTKYFGVCLLPLLLVYTLRAHDRSRLRPEQRASHETKPSLLLALLALCIPLTVLIAYDLWMRRYYDRDLLLDAIGFSIGSHSGMERYALRVGLVFTGGCLAPVLFYLPLLWPRRKSFALIALALVVPLPLWLRLVVAEWNQDGWYLLQAVLFLLGGFAVVALAGADLWRHRDADGWLLFLWTAGTLAFALQINWVINGRTLLPLAPVVGILIARRLDWLRGPEVEWNAWKEYGPLVPAALVALFVAVADYRQAEADRTAAHLLADEFAARPGELWFEGHWGFQYYLRQRGAREVSRGEQATSFVPGDLLILPENNYGIFYEPPEDRAHLVLTVERPTFALAHTMSKEAGAGFYSHVHGPLPFVFGPTAPMRYRVFRFIAPANAGKGDRTGN